MCYTNKKFYSLSKITVTAWLDFDDTTYNPKIPIRIFMYLQYVRIQYASIYYASILTWIYSRSML